RDAGRLQLLAHLADGDGGEETGTAERAARGIERGNAGNVADAFAELGFQIFRRIGEPLLLADMGIVRDGGRQGLAFSRTPCRACHSLADTLQGWGIESGAVLNQTVAGHLAEAGHPAV